MSFYDLMGSIGTSLANYGYATGSAALVCQLQAYLIHIGLLGGILWSACMATNLVLKFSFNLSLEDLKGVEKYYHLFVLILSFLPATAMLVMNNT